MLRFFPERTKVVFFDLEYYVPTADRNRASLGGRRYSPVLKGHKILGGSFLTYFPMQDRIGPRHRFWEWKLGSERNVLEAIVSLFEKEWRPLQAKAQTGSLMLAGIGISHSDIPSLLAAISREEISTKERVYDLISGCRQIDLAVATYCQFSFNNAYFSYPKTKSELYNKYLNGKRVETGSSVWDHYDAGNYDAIEKRCEIEVNDTLSVYKAMFDTKKAIDHSLRRLKQLERKRSIAGKPER